MTAVASLVFVIQTFAADMLWMSGRYLKKKQYASALTDLTIKYIEHGTLNLRIALHAFGCASQIAK